MVFLVLFSVVLVAVLSDAANVLGFAPTFAQEAKVSGPALILPEAALPMSGPVLEATSTADMSSLDRDILALAKAAAGEVSQVLESAIDRGLKSEEEIFSTLYFPITPSTSPRTFSTFYDDYTDQFVTPIEDRYLAMNRSIVFVVLVDRNGYLPSHNSRFSQPRTGNLEQDLKSNRTKRVFNDLTGFRAAKNREEFLLQVYRRDTGELMKDLSVPVTVRGKRWGALRMGYANE